MVIDSEMKGTPVSMTDGSQGSERRCGVGPWDDDQVLQVMMTRLVLEVMDGECWMVHSGRRCDKGWISLKGFRVLRTETGIGFSAFPKYPKIVTSYDLLGDVVFQRNQTAMDVDDVMDGVSVRD